jgi:hypothetical protein
MNGAGISGILLDPSKNMILVLDFQYLGVGRVRFGFDINGYIYYCHEFVHANETSGVYMSSPNLPVRWEIVATGTASGNTTLKAICCCVISEGGHNPKGLVFNHNLGNTPKSASQGVRVPVVSLRLKPTFNRVPVLPLKSDTMSTGNQNCLMEYWLLRAGGTASLTSATFSISPHTQSSVNIDIDATSLTIGDAVRIGSDYISSVSKDSEIILSNYKVLSNIAGTSDILCITAMGIGGNATGVHNSLTWLEEF